MKKMIVERISCQHFDGVIIIVTLVVTYDLHTHLCTLIISVGEGKLEMCNWDWCRER